MIELTYYYCIPYRVTIAHCHQKWVREAKCDIILVKGNGEGTRGFDERGEQTYIDTSVAREGKIVVLEGRSAFLAESSGRLVCWLATACFGVLPLNSKQP